MKMASKGKWKSWRKRRRKWKKKRRRRENENERKEIENEIWRNEEERNDVIENDEEEAEEEKKPKKEESNENVSVIINMTYSIIKAAMKISILIENIIGNNVYGS